MRKFGFIVFFLCVFCAGVGFIAGLLTEMALSDGYSEATTIHLGDQACNIKLNEAGVLPLGNGEAFYFARLKYLVVRTSQNVKGE